MPKPTHPQAEQRAQLGIRARQIPHAIQFLRSLGVPATRIGGILGESADYIRHIDGRAYQTKAQTALVELDGEDIALARLSEAERIAQRQRNLQGIRIRTRKVLDEVEVTVWNIVHNHQSFGFKEAYEALLEMKPGVANARHGDALKVLLLLEEKLAWFAMPLGETEAAVCHSQRAMSLARDAFRESAGDVQYLLRYGEAALIASICLQKLHHPIEALAFIQAADATNEAAGQLPGSEHLRQRGAALIQIGSRYDDIAKKVLAHAPKRMERKCEARQIVDLGMSGFRHLAFLDPASEWDRAQEFARDVAAVYGENSMQHAVAVKSAAAVGLKYETSESNQAVLRMLDSISTVPSGSLLRGVPHLLSMTPELGLAGESLDRWLRFAMYDTPRPSK